MTEDIEQPLQAPSKRTKAVPSSIPTVAVQLGPYRRQHLVGVRHRIGTNDPVQRQQQMHDRIVDQLEKHCPAGVIGAQPADDGDQARPVHVFDGGLQLIGHGSGRGIQTVERGDRVIDAFGQLFE